jgi:hypothetical protein
VEFPHLLLRLWNSIFGWMTSMLYWISTNQYTFLEFCRDCKSRFFPNPHLSNMKIGTTKRWDWETILISHIGRETIVIPFHIRHKLYYFHFCRIFRKNKYWMLKISKIQSRLLDSNPRPFQWNNKTFHRCNQKHNRKLKKILTILLNLLLICQIFQIQKLKHWIKIFKLYSLFWHINVEPEKVLWYLNKGCVTLCHIVALPFTLKRILSQKKKYGNSHISPCKNIIFKKSPLKKTKIIKIL